MTMRIIDILKTMSPLKYTMLPKDFGITNLASLPTAFTGDMSAQSITAGTDPVVTYHYFELPDCTDICANVLLTAIGSDVASVKTQLEGTNFGPSSTAAGCWTVCSEEKTLSAVSNAHMPVVLTINSVVSTHPAPFRWYRLKTTVTKGAGSTNKVATYYAIATGTKV